MKRIIRFLVVSLVMLTMVSGLTGCRKFEQMRQRQGKLSEDGILTVQGDKYRLLPACDFLNPDFGYSNDVIYVAADDTPVLLARFFGTQMDISKDRKFVLASMGDTYVPDVNVNQLYCHMDEYESVLAAIEKGYEPDGYKFEYYDWEEDELREYVFSDEEAKAVDMVLNGQPSEEDEKGFMQSFSVYSCVKGTVFSQYEVELMVADDDSYYLERFDKEIGVSHYYRVPAELCTIFEEIVMEVNY